MIGRLRLRATARLGHTVLSELTCAFPVVVLRPRCADADGWLTVTVLTPSGGLLAGDGLEADVVVEEGAKLEVRTQAATQLHAGRSSQHWRFSVASGAALAFAPHALVPHAGAHHGSRVCADIGDGAGLFLAEIVAPGRVHQCGQGELWAYDELRLDTDVRCDGLLAARERQCIRPTGADLRTQLGGNTHFGSAYVFGAELDAGQEEDCAASRLAFGGTCERFLGASAFEIEDAIQRTAAQFKERR